MNPLKRLQTSWLLFLFCMPFAVFSQNVAAVGNNVITTSEFVWVYKKNNPSRPKATYEQLSAYLKRYADFRLKVLDALSLDLHKDSAYVKEVTDFEKIVRTKLRSRSKQEVEFVLNEYKSGVLMFNVSERKIWAPVYGDQAITVAQTEERERDWLIELRNRYPVTINEAELRRLSVSKW